MTPFSLPDKWLNRVIPWRGWDRPQALKPIEKVSARDCFQAHSVEIDKELARSSTTDQVRDSIRACDWDKPDHNLALPALLGFSGSVGLLAWTLETHGTVPAIRSWAQSTHFGSWYRGLTYQPNPAVSWRTAPAEFLRRTLATLPEAEYRVAVTELRDPAVHPVHAAYIAPTEPDLVAAALAITPVDHTSFGLLLCVVETESQVHELVVNTPTIYTRPYGMPNFATAAVRAGTAITEAIAAAFKNEADTDGRLELMDLLTYCPTPEAFRQLLGYAGTRGGYNAIRSALEHHPGVGLAELVRSGTEAAAVELQAFVLTQPEKVAAASPGLDDATRATIEKITAAHDALPESDSPPAILLNPPWIGRKKAAKPPVIELPTELPAAFHWSPGQRERLLATQPTFAFAPQYMPSWQRLAEGGYSAWQMQGAMVQLSSDDALALVRHWTPAARYWDAGWLPYALARFGVDAYPAAVRALDKSAVAAAYTLIPVRSHEVAPRMAEFLLRRGKLRAVALDWLRCHGLDAVAYLVPAALGRAGTHRRGAEAALRRLAVDHSREQVVDRAHRYGDEAAAAIAVLLDIDSLTILPARIPAPPAWLTPQLLPQIALPGRQSALPRELVPTLITMCQLGDADAPYAGLETVAALCDPESLSRWAWAIFQQYRRMDYPSKDVWVLRLQGWLGDDDTVRSLSPLIQAWPGESAHQRAVVGLDVLSDIGTDVALMHLYRISQKVPFKALRAKAADKIEQIADGLELTPEQLGDRLVPDFGLSPQGTATLDFGPRQFVVGFDESLKPYLTDAEGKPRKALPKPAAADDADLAAAATKAFSALKKDVRGAASDQIARLQRAMRYQRRFDAADFRAYFVSHPLVGVLVRRLVWGTYETAEPNSPLLQSFRVAEDNSLADAEDNPFELDENAVVGAVHPAQLSAELLAAWSELFADYELLQPFPQLSRPVYRLTDSEKSTNVLSRFDKLTVPSRVLLGLAKQGWNRDTPADAGVQNSVIQTLPSGAEVSIDLDPGIPVGEPDMLGDQTIQRVELSSGTYGDIDPVLISEILADLTELERHRL